MYTIYSETKMFKVLRKGLKDLLKITKNGFPLYNLIQFTLLIKFRK